MLLFLPQAIYIHQVCREAEEIRFMYLECFDSAGEVISSSQFGGVSTVLHVEKEITEHCRVGNDDYHNCVKWEFSLDKRLLCVWERSIGSAELPVVTRRSPSYAGEWKKDPDEVEI